MSLASLLVHSCAVTRPTHDNLDKQKILGETAIATGVACRLEAPADVTQATLLGIGQVVTRRAFFLGDADIQRGDILTLSTGETAVVRGVEPRYAGTADVHHLEVALEVRQV